jgi:inner membrane protease ATP23
MFFFFGPRLYCDRHRIRSAEVISLKPDTALTFAPPKVNTTPSRPTPCNDINYARSVSRLFQHILTMSTNTPKSPQEPSSNDLGKTGYDPSRPWWNRWNILTGNMSQRGQEEFREAAYIRNEARDCANCEEWRDYCFKYSPMVIFMQKNIKDLNGDLNAENVKCRRCPTWRDENGRLTRQGGGFSPEHGILLCANEMRDKKHLEDTLSHEMVHAWDHLRWKVDWADLRHAACSEV